MKYIRTKDDIVEITKELSYCYLDKNNNEYEFGKYKVADTIEELCDCFSYDVEITRDFIVARSWKLHHLEREIYGCIKTDKGLIYVAKMNDKGELELL